MMMMFIYTFSIILIVVAKSNGQDAPPLDSPPAAAFAPQAPPVSGDCGYTRLPNLMKKEGGNIASYNVNYETCKSYCSGEPACNSFTYCSIGELKCHLKRKVVNPNKPRKNKNSCTTSYPNSCKGREVCKREGDACGSAGNGENYGTCCTNGFAPTECRYDGTPGSVEKCSVVERERCKREGDACGTAGNGQNYGTCCNDGFAPVECQYSGRPGGVGKCSVVTPCEDDPNWTDFRHGGDGNAHCVDMTLDWCNNQGAYSTEAKRACPKSCGVCTPRYY